MKTIKLILSFLILLGCYEVLACSSSKSDKDKDKTSKACVDCDSSLESYNVAQSPQESTGYIDSRMKMIDKAKSRVLASENYKKCMDSNVENLSQEDLIKSCKTKMSEETSSPQN